MKFVLSLTAVAVLTVSAPAMAGFQWVPPQSNPTAKPSERITPVAPDRVINHIRNNEPLPMVEPEPVAMPAPVSAGSLPAPVMASPVMPAPSMNTMPSSPDIMPPIAPSFNDSPAPVVAPVQGSASNMPSAFEPVVGFGDNLPLALAMTDIVPSSYSHAFASGVNPGVSVSWDGQGRGWDVVLAEILRPHGLVPVMRGRHIVVTHGSAAPKVISSSNSPQPYEMSQPTTMRMQQTAMPTVNMRAPQPPLNQFYTNPQPMAEPFSQNYEPILLTPAQP